MLTSFLSKVQDSGDVLAEGRVRVVFSTPCEPGLEALIQNQHVSPGPPGLMRGRWAVAPSDYLLGTRCKYFHEG